MSKHNRLQFYHFAPDVELLDSNGKAVRLSSFWAERPLLLAFTRHFGCPQCKELLAELSEGSPRLREAGINLAVVTQASAKAAAAFCERFAPGITCLADPERAAYRAYGLGRGTLRQTVLSPEALLSNARLRRSRGWNAEAPPAGQDALVMAGLFIIGTDGRIRLPYYYDHIADHPPLDLLLRGIMGVEWSQPFEGPIIGKESSSHE